MEETEQQENKELQENLSTLQKTIQVLTFQNQVLGKKNETLHSQILEFQIKELKDGKFDFLIKEIDINSEKEIENSLSKAFEYIEKWQLQRKNNLEKSNKKEADIATV